MTAPAVPCPDSARERRLDADLLAAHAADDKSALVALYAEAAAAGAANAAAFYLTQAYIYALDLGDARASSLRGHLVALNAEY